MTRPKKESGSAGRSLQQEPENQVRIVSTSTAPKGTLWVGANAAVMNDYPPVSCSIANL